MHHRGELLLTTGTAFGPAYDRWMLARPEPIDPEQSLYSMRLLDHGQHGLHDVAFVDAYVAHVPMYSPSLTITVCLWSSRAAKSWKDSLKRIEALRRRRDSLRGFLVRLGMAKALDLKVVELHDYRPADGGLIGMKEREEFALGPNEDHLHSLFHIIQQTGNERLADLIEARLREDDADNPETASALQARLRNGEPIEGRLSQGHF